KSIDIGYFVTELENAASRRATASSARRAESAASVAPASALSAAALAWAAAVSALVAEVPAAVASDWAFCFAKAIWAPFEQAAANATSITIAIDFTSFFIILTLLPLIPVRPPDPNCKRLLGVSTGFGNLAIVTNQVGRSKIILAHKCASLHQSKS